MKNKEDIFIIGIGGFSKEVYFLIKETGIYNVKGFISKDIEEDSKRVGKEIIKIIDEFDFLNNYNKGLNVAIGVGKPFLIKKIAEKFKNFKMPNIIHPSLIFDKKNIKIGIGNIITAGVIFTTDINIGSFNIFNLNSTIGHDTLIGNYNVFNPSTNISGNNKIGNGNLFGVGSISLENMEIGDNNVIGASALLTKNINNDGVYVGIPAKIMKNNN